MELIKLVECFVQPICVICSQGRAWLCDGCRSELISPRAAHCYRCGALSDSWLTCRKCHRTSSVHQLISFGPYEGSLKRMVDSYKYGKRRMLSTVINDAVFEQIGNFNQELIVVPVPSARSRVRERGFGHIERLALGLAHLQAAPFHDLLERVGSSRQVGVERRLRFKQAAGNYRLKDSAYEKKLSSTVVLVDDVVTSGATVEAAAKELKKHPRVKHVIVICIAHNT